MPKIKELKRKWKKMSAREKLFAVSGVALAVGGASYAVYWGVGKKDKIKKWMKKFKRQHLQQFKRAA